MKILPKNLIVVVGSDGGLGSAIVTATMDNPNNHVLSIPCDQLDFRFPAAVVDVSSDIRRDTHLAIIEGLLSPDYYPVLINCVGKNYIEWFTDADLHQLQDLMRINCLSHIELVQDLIGSHEPAYESEKEFNDWFRGTGALIEIISNASHMPMTNSVFYNASKGAQHIATLALGRELRKTHGLTVFGISPNKLKGTGMSNYIDDRVPDLRGWTPEQAASYQLASLPAGEETDPAALAGLISYLVSAPENHKYLANTVIPYGA